MLVSQEKKLTIQNKIFSAQYWLPEGDSKSEPVIALHGWLDNSESFSRLAPQLKNSEILALDMAGHGHSDHRSEDAAYHIWDDVKEVLLVADKMGWQQFTLLGHSRGAIISVIIAAVAPQRVKQIILLEGLLPLTAEEDQTAAQLQKYLQKSLNRKALEKKQRRHYELEQMIAIRRQGGFDISEAAARCIIERGVEKVALVGENELNYRWRNDLRLLMASPMMLTPNQARDFLSKVKCPIHLLAASKIMGQHLDAIKTDLSQNHFVDIVVFEGGHHFHMEGAVDEIASYINELSMD